MSKSFLDTSFSILPPPAILQSKRTTVHSVELFKASSRLTSLVEISLETLNPNLSSGFRSWHLFSSKLGLPLICTRWPPPRWAQRRLGLCLISPLSNPWLGNNPQILKWWKNKYRVNIRNQTRDRLWGLWIFIYLKSCLQVLYTGFENYLE